MNVFVPVRWVGRASSIPLLIGLGEKRFEGITVEEEALGLQLRTVELRRRSISQVDNLLAKNRYLHWSRSSVWS